MFSHHGVRALWPVVFFLPWLSVGAVYLASAIRSRLAFSAASLRLVALALLLITAPLALADPLPEGHTRCPVTTQQEARRLGDTLFEHADYQSAGECYQAAGEYALANRAFVRAVEPKSAVTARQLTEQRDQAKTMARKIQLAFRREH
jgi:hypothetical protein